MADLYEIMEMSTSFNIKRLSAKLKVVVEEMDRRARKAARVEFRVAEREEELPVLSPDEIDDDTLTELRQVIVARWSADELREEMLADLPGISEAGLAEELDVDAALAHLYVKAFEPVFMEMVSKKLSSARAKGSRAVAPTEEAM